LLALAEYTCPCDVRMNWLFLRVARMAQEGDLGQSAVPLPGDVRSAIRPKVSDQAALQVAEHSQVPAGVRASSRARGKGDDWLIWVLALTSW
jgi:hypothetical protein